MKQAEAKVDKPTDLVPLDFYPKAKRLLNLEDMPDPDFERFMAKCNASGLNPLLNHAVPVERNKYDKKTKKYLTTYSFQATKEGLLYRASHWPNFNTPQSAYVMPGDHFLADLNKGEMEHKIGPEHFKRGVKPLCGWARMRLKNGDWKLKVLDFGAWEPTYWVDKVKKVMPMWDVNGGKPGNQIEKCAIVMLLKEVYPRQWNPMFDFVKTPDDYDALPPGDQTTVAVEQGEPPKQLLPPEEPKDITPPPPPPPEETEPESEGGDICPVCGVESVFPNKHSKTGAHAYFCWKEKGGCGVSLTKDFEVSPIAKKKPPKKPKEPATPPPTTQDEEKPPDRQKRIWEGRRTISKLIIAHADKEEFGNMSKDLITEKAFKKESMKFDEIPNVEDLNILMQAYNELAIILSPKENKA